MEDLEKLVEQAQTAIEAAEDNQALDQIRVQYLGKKGEITGLLKNLGKLSKEERPDVIQAWQIKFFRILFFFYF